MSTLSVSYITTPSNTTPLILSSANDQAAFIRVEAANNDIIFNGFTKFNGGLSSSSINAAFDTANAALPNVSNAVFAGNLRITGNLQIGTNTVTIRDNHIISAEYYRMNTANHMVAIPDGNRVNTIFIIANSAYDKANAALPNVSNAVFQGNLRVTGTLSIGSNTVTISDTSLSSQTLSANTITANTSNNRHVKSNYYTPKDISSVNGCYNAFLMIVDGKLYSCHGTQGSWASYQTGRYDGASYQADWGFEGLRRVHFPYETTGRVIQADFSGTYCAYALFDNGNLYTWGYNNYGTCGLGDTSQRYVPVLAATSVTAVYSTGWLTGQNNHTASRLYIKKSDGYIYGAGYNGYGALGLGDTTNRSSFTQISGLGTSCKYLHNFGADNGSAWAVMNDNSIYVCGYNGYGQFGNGGTSSYSSFIDVTSYFNPSKHNVVKIFGDSGTYNTIAILLSNGDLYTCGYNGNYQIGNGSASNIYTPYKVLTGVTNAWNVGGGGSAGTYFATKGDNVLWAWGYNGYGQCGTNGTTGITSPTITINGTFRDFMNDKSMDPTHPHYTQSIIKDTSNNLYVAGWSGYGENGTGSVSNSNTGWNRILLPGDFNCTTLGAYCTTGTTRGYLAIGDDNRMYAWGYNGQYGVHNNSIGQQIVVPMQVFMRLGG